MGANIKTKVMSKPINGCRLATKRISHPTNKCLATFSGQTVLMGGCPFIGAAKVIF